MSEISYIIQNAWAVFVLLILPMMALFFAVKERRFERDAQRYNESLEEED